MTIRIAGGQAGYGDSLEPLPALLADGIDYLVCDALAESTLAVLSKDRRRDPALGYTRDIVGYVEAASAYLRSGRTRYITNAGGLNPRAAAAAVTKLLAERGLHGVQIATVTGDELTSRHAEFSIPGDTEFAVCYLGARPIVAALASGAQIVITGRVADASLFLAPLVHEFGWDFGDADRVAAGVTIGHLLECSAQVSGSVYSGDWWTDPDPSRPGFPIAEVDADGSAVITKPAGTGGQVTFDTVREQLMYEVHDPGRYLNPDVTADFTAVSVEPIGTDRVRVSGACGTSAPPAYKGLYCETAGWGFEFTHTYSWPDALQKAQLVAGVVQERAHRLGIEVQDWCVEYFGAGAHHGPTAEADLAAAYALGVEPAEIALRVAWRCATREAAEAVGGRVGGTVPPMSTPFGRPKRRPATQLLRLTGFAADRPLVDGGVEIKYQS